MSKFAAYISVFALFIVLVAPASAQVVTTPSTTGGDKMFGPNIRLLQNGSGTASGSAFGIDRVKARAAMELSRRISALQKLLQRLSGLKRLTADQKTTLTSEVQDQITTLTALQSKIQADTDLQTAKTDTQSIISSYRIFALFMPQMTIISSADRMLNLTDKFSSMEAKLQSRLTEAQSKGLNISSMQAYLTDMQSKTADANTQAQNALTMVLSLTPAGYPANKVTLQNARQLLVTGHTDLMSAFQDIQKIIQGLRELIRGGTPIPQATTSASPSPTGI